MWAAAGGRASAAAGWGAGVPAAHARWCVRWYAYLSRTVTVTGYRVYPPVPVDDAYAYPHRGYAPRVNPTTTCPHSTHSTQHTQHIHCGHTVPTVVPPQAPNTAADTAHSDLAFTRCYKILFHFEVLLLLHNNIFCKHPPKLCNILHNITSYCTPPPDFEVFFRCLEVFGFEGIFLLALVVGFWMGGGVWKKIVLDTEKGALLHIIVQYAIPPSQPPFIAYNIAQYNFPTTPFIAIKYWQYLVRAKQRHRLIRAPSQLEMIDDDKYQVYSAWGV